MKMNKANYSRMNRIKEMVKNYFHYSDVIVGFTHYRNTYDVECSTDGELYTVKCIPAIEAVSDDNVLAEIELAGIRDTWEEAYTLHENSIVLKNIIQQHNLNDLGYHMWRNTFYKESDELFRAWEVTNINLSVDDDEFKSLKITTGTYTYEISEDDYCFYDTNNSAQNAKIEDIVKRDILPTIKFIDTRLKELYSTTKESYLKDHKALTRKLLDECIDNYYTGKAVKA